MFKKIAFSLALTVMGWTCAHAATETPVKVEDFNFNAKKVTLKDGAATLSGSVFMVSKKTFPCTAGKKYGIKGTFKALPGTPDNFVYIGFEIYDKNGKSIAMAHAKTVPNTLTTLVQDVKTSDTVLKVEDASKWIQKGAFRVALKAAKDESDLPNRNVTQGNVLKVEKKGNSWEVTLSKPCGFEAKAGEFVREHRHGGYLYTVFGKTGRGFVDPEHTAVIDYPGAAGIRIVILGNWNAPEKGENPKMEVKNVRLIEK